VVTLRVCLKLDLSARARIAIETGRVLALEKELELDFESFKPASRELVVRIGGLSEKLDLRSVQFGACQSDFLISSYPEHESDWVLVLSRYLELIECRQVEPKSREAEKLVWVEENGSKYLQKLLAYGYGADIQYAKEPSNTPAFGLTLIDIAKPSRSNAQANFALSLRFKPVVVPCGYSIHLPGMVCLKPNAKPSWSNITFSITA
jgi:hypothetical protein